LEVKYHVTFLKQSKNNPKAHRHQERSSGRFSVEGKSPDRHDLVTIIYSQPLKYEMDHITLTIVTEPVYGQIDDETFPLSIDAIDALIHFQPRSAR
jgi:hypothetical protein